MTRDTIIDKVNQEFFFYDREYFQINSAASISLYFTCQAKEDYICLSDSEVLYYSELIQVIRNAAEDQTERLQMNSIWGVLLYLDCSNSGACISIAKSMSEGHATKDGVEILYNFGVRKGKLNLTIQSACAP